MREPTSAVVRKEINWEHDLRGKKAIMRSRKKVLTSAAKPYYPKEFITELPPHAEYCMLTGFSVVTIVDQLDDNTVVFTVDDSADPIEVMTAVSSLHRILCDDECIPDSVPHRGQLPVDYLLRIW